MKRISFLEKKRNKQILTLIGLLGLAILLVTLVEIKSRHLLVQQNVENFYWSIYDTHSVVVYWQGEATSVTVIPESGSIGKRVEGKILGADGRKIALLSGLDSDTEYQVEIGSSDQYRVRTAPANGQGQDYSIVVEGDIGASEEATLVQEHVLHSNPRFVLAVGDLTYANIHGKKSRQQHFSMVSNTWGKSVAYMPVWGNHEFKKGDNIDYYINSFFLPNTKALSYRGEITEEAWYWFDYGSTRFIAYPEPDVDSWDEWNRDVQSLDGPLVASLEDPKIKTIVFFGHRPAFSSGKYVGVEQLAKIFSEIRGKFPKTKLVLNGHSHNYERTKQISGITYITVGTGGESLESGNSSECEWSICEKPTWSEARFMNYGFLQLNFSQDLIQGKFYCVESQDHICSSEVLDDFTL
jgi:hypothetical protein